MKITVLVAVLSLLPFPSAGWAQGGAQPYPSPTVSGSGRVEAVNPYPDAVHTTRLYANRSDCQPDAADPVWGAGQQFIGFSCFRTPQ